MEPDKNSDQKPDSQKPATDQPNAPADALSRTPEDLDEEKSEQAAASAASNPVEAKPDKKISPVKRLFRRLNLYFLFFLIILVIAAAIAIVTYLNSQKAPVEATVATQELTESALKQLANNDASVGSSAQTLTIKGNTIIEGQALARGDLNVAGNFQAGGKIQGPSLTISGDANLGSTQLNNLQVSADTAVQGNTTLRDLSVAGSATFSGPVTASQLTVSSLVVSGNGGLKVPNHISFTGPTPSRTIGNALGSGGSLSLSGSDTAGSMNINTGNGTSAGCFARVNFQKTFSSQPRVIVSPVGAAAGRTQYYVSRDTAGFSICASSPAPTNQAFGFDYFVAG